MRALAVLPADLGSVVSTDMRLRTGRLQFQGIGA